MVLRLVYCNDHSPTSAYQRVPTYLHEHTCTYIMYLYLYTHPPVSTTCTFLSKCICLPIFLPTIYLSTYTLICWLSYLDWLYCALHLLRSKYSECLCRYVAHWQLFRILNIDTDKATAAMNEIYEFERRLAEIYIPQEIIRDPAASYKKVSGYGSNSVSAKQVKIGVAQVKSKGM